jgi:small-conductance mechanosensitive channel
MSRYQFPRLPLCAFVRSAGFDCIMISNLRHSAIILALRLFGIDLIGINAANGRRLLFTVAFVIAVVLITSGIHALLKLLLRGREAKQVAFWLRQVVRLLTAFVLILGIVSIWFNDPARFATFFGLVSAGLAFALQRVITAFAGYFVILRGKTFNVGDRIMMGGVRGDVIALGFIQTTIMEMGQPPGEQGDDPSMWVKSRQYTGRIVTVTNDKIFDNPIYNYTREFPYIWEEMTLPIGYKSDRATAERILMDAVERHTVKISEMSEEAIGEMERRYVMKRTEIRPRVYMRLTDNWVELAVRFIAKDHGVRELKDAMSRQIIDALDQAGIEVASGTYAIVELPPVKVIQQQP